MEHPAGSHQSKEAHHAAGTEKLEPPQFAKKADQKDKCQFHRRGYLHHIDIQGEGCPGRRTSAARHQKLSAQSENISQKKGHVGSEIYLCD